MTYTPPPKCTICYAPQTPNPECCTCPCSSPIILDITGDGYNLTDAAHGVMAQKMLFEKPISMARESKPGENPKNGARPFTGEELAAIRKATVYKNSRKQVIDDTPTLLLLRWAGLRVSDAV